MPAWMARDGGRVTDVLDTDAERERRDLAARVARDRLANMLGIHPRSLHTVDSELAQLISGHLNRNNRRIKALVDSSTVDDLTGALRRQAGLEALERELSRARRLNDQRLVLAFVDLDSLKRVNDSEGHGAGDRLLTQVAQTLRARLRAYDLVARWGGDEFICVLPEAGLKGASRILREIAREFESERGHGFSVGFAEVSELSDGEGAAELVARADANLYEERRSRRAAPRARPRLLVLTAAVITVLLVATAGAAAGAATPSSILWAPHAAVDAARVALSSNPADTELQLARERVAAAAAAPDGSARSAWAQNALNLLGMARRDGANQQSVNQLQNVARSFKSQ